MNQSVADLNVDNNYDLFYNRFVELRNAVKSDYKRLRSISAQPELFVSNYFYELRNEIDITAEMFLFKISTLEKEKLEREQKRSEIKSDQLFESYTLDSDSEKLTEIKLDDEPPFDPDQVNTIRSDLIGHLKILETDSLHKAAKLDKSIVASIENKLADLNQDLNELPIELNKILANDSELREKLVLAFRQSKKSLASIQLNLNELYSHLLDNKRLFFLRGFCNPFGILVQLDANLNDYELNILK